MNAKTLALIFGISYSEIERGTGRNKDDVDRMGDFELTCEYMKIQDKRSNLSASKRRKVERRYLALKERGKR
jgi:hypothetical protein